MATLRTKYKPWLKTEYRGTEIDLPHEASHVVTNPLGEIVAYTSEPRIGGDGWAASGFMYVLGYNADPTRWWESCVTSGYLMDVAAGVLPREAKQQAYRNYWYAGGPIRVPTWAQWVAEDMHGNIVVIEGAMRPNVGVCGKWANSRNQLFVRRDRPADNWRQTLINLDHLSQMEFKRPKGFPDELRPVCYQSKEVLVPLWVNFLTTDADGAIRGHHTRPTIIDKSGWHTAECSRIPMCYLGYTPNRGNWKDTLLILKQKESEQKVEKEQKPKQPTKADQVRAQADAARNGWAPPQPLLCYRGENLTFEQGYNWVATDGLGHVYTFDEKPTAGTPKAFWSCESGRKLLVSRRGARNDWERSLTEIKHLSTNESEDYKSVYYKDIRFWVPSWVYFIAADIDNYLRGYQKMPKYGWNIWFHGGRHFNIGIIPAVGVLNWKASLYDVLENKYLGHPIDEIRTQAISDACEAKTETEPDGIGAPKIWSDLAEHPRIKGEPSGFFGAFRTINAPPILTSEKLAEIRAYKLTHGNGVPPELLTDEAQQPVHVGVDTGPAESFTMVTFKLPSKTVATQETMLTDEMFLAGVAFGMRLNKLLSKLDDKND